MAQAEPELRKLPVFSVGDRTGACARAAGFATVVSAGGNSEDLVALICERQAPGSELLFLSGHRQGQEVTRALRAAGHAVEHRYVYGSLLMDSFPQAALEALRAETVAACLFFSSEIVRNFGRLLPVESRPLLAGIHAIAISGKAAHLLEPMPWRSVATAPHPDAVSLLSLLGVFDPE